MDNRTRVIIDILKQNFDPFLIYIFGSEAKYLARSDSDIDIAFFNEQKNSRHKVFMISQKIAEIEKKEIDLVDLSKSSLVLQFQIVTTGKVIYCSDDHKRMLFEMKTLKMYTDFNEERKEIIANVKKRGSVFG